MTEAQPLMWDTGVFNCQIECPLPRAQSLHPTASPIKTFVSGGERSIHEIFLLGGSVHKYSHPKEKKVGNQLTQT